jgi:predicted nucleic acid-binding protein
LERSWRADPSVPRLRSLASKLSSWLDATHFETRFIISSLTVLELEHGWHRAKTAEQARKRRRYLDEVFSIVPVEGFTAERGVLAAKVDVGLKTTGVVVAPCAWRLLPAGRSGGPAEE